jgi:hypothetical protein
MLRSRDIAVTFLVRENSLSGVYYLSAKAKWSIDILEHHIDLKLDTNLVEIISDDKGHVKAILTDKGETIECQIVGFNVSSNIDFLKESGIELGKGIC